MSSLIPYTEMLNKHEGQIAFVLGCGTSLCEINTGPKSPIHDHVVLTTNSGILAVPWINGEQENRYWISNDSSVMKWDYWENIRSSKCNKIIRNSWSKFYHKLDSSFYEFWPRPTEEGTINKEDKGLAYCSSIPSCIDFAIQSGCKKIFLLGVDQYRAGIKSHFWQKWPPNKQPKRIFSSRPNSWHEQEKVFLNYNNRAYSALAKFAEEMNCKIYNCNPKSRVVAFDKISFEQSLNIR